MSAAVHSVSRRLALAARTMAPEAMSERMRLLGSGVLEHRAGQASAVRGAAIVLPAVYPLAGDPDGESTGCNANVAREPAYVLAYTGRIDVFADSMDPTGRWQPQTATVGGFALQLARALAHP